MKGFKCLSSIYCMFKAAEKKKKNVVLREDNVLTDPVLTIFLVKL